MNIGHNLRLLTGDEPSGFLVRVGLAPCLLKAHDARALTLRHLGKAVGEISVCEYGKLGSGLHKINHRSFHARAAGAGDD